MAINELPHEEQIAQLQDALRRERERVTLAEKRVALAHEALKRAYEFQLAKNPDRNDRGGV